jgi:hypothetical protein
MAKLEWDQVGERRFETGIDHGVLYLPDESAVPWNGLLSVVEDTSRDVKSYFLDGIKYMDRHNPGAYSAKLQAYTYPDELDELLGTSEFIPGVQLHDQRARLFHLSYRTLVANDLEGVDHGYKIHLIYNVMANPNDATYKTLDASVSADAFEWSLSGTPPNVFGIRPTSHISLDSRHIDSDLLETIEGLIYGTEDDDPSFPSMVDLLALVEAA